MTNCSSSQWISSNLSLTGFTVANAALMTCKELIENAIDATRDVPEQRASLVIEANADHFVITCNDNGRGFASDSVDAIHTLFRSSKVGECSVKSTGKFGIGLKAMALMSSRECGGKDVTIRSLAEDADKDVTFTIGCGDSGEVEIKSLDVSDRGSDDGGFTTTVAVCVPCCPIESFRKSLWAYLSELGRFVDSSITVSFIDEDPVVFCEDSSLSRCVQYKDPSGFVSCLVSWNSDFSGENNQLSIIRFVNGVPLVTTNGSNCLLLHGVLLSLTRLSASLGIQLGHPLVPKVDASLVASTVVVEGAPHESSWTQLVVRVNLTAPADQVDYACLSKSSVSGLQGSNLTMVVSRCLRVALRRLQSKFASQFQSVEAFEHKNAVGRYIPVIVHNLIEMADRVQTDEIRAKLTDLLGADFDAKQKLFECLLRLLGPPKGVLVEL